MKSPVLTGKLLLEREIEVGDRKCLMPLRYLVYLLTSLIILDARRTQKWAGVWVH